MWGCFGSSGRAPSIYLAINLKYTHTRSITHKYVYTYVCMCVCLNLWKMPMLFEAKPNSGYHPASLAAPPLSLGVQRRIWGSRLKGLEV